MNALPERWTAVINPAAGRRRSRARVPLVADALAGVDADVRIEMSADLDHAIAIARAAFDGGRGVVACGGDGTVSALAGVAADCRGVLAVVPAGSGNDFARQLGVPSDEPAAAAALLRTGRVGTFDLGRVEAGDGAHAWFTTVANAGFDAEANRWANGVQSISGTPLYVVAVLRTLATYRPRRLRVTVDDEVLDTEGWLVAAANTRSYAGGMVIAPDASIADGRLDVCVVGRVSRAEFLRTFPKVFGGTHVDHPSVLVRRGGQIGVEMPEAVDAPEVWASGERVGPLPARVEAVAGALRAVTSR